MNLSIYNMLNQIRKSLIFMTWTWDETKGKGEELVISIRQQNERSKKD